jgi:hypothetical protein
MTQETVGNCDRGVFDTIPSEETLADVLSYPFSTQEYRHAAEAAKIAQDAGLFSSATECDEWAFLSHESGSDSGSVDRDRLSRWKAQLEGGIRNQTGSSASVVSTSSDKQCPRLSEVNA